jgi:hypothetical protein
VAKLYHTRSGKAFMGLGNGAQLETPMRGGFTDVNGAIVDALFDLHVDWAHRPLALLWVSKNSTFSILPCTMGS